MRTRVSRQLSQRGIGQLTALVLLGALAAFVLTGLYFGSDLLSNYRFQSELNRLAQLAREEGGQWPQLPQTCVACHGFNGSPVNDRYARLAGQPAAYISAQLRGFASGARHHPTMTPLALALSDEEVRQLSAYFERQTPHAYDAPALSAQSVASGASVAKRLNCTSCHGADLAGQDAVPALAAQSASYLVDQLKAYKLGDRKDPTGVMNAVAIALSSQDIDDTAVYLADVPAPTSGGRGASQSSRD